MSPLLLLLSAFICGASLADAPPKWAQMQKAVLVERDLDQIKALVQSGVDPNAPIGCGTFAPLDGAIQQENPEMVELLLSLGATPTESQMVKAAFCSNPDAALKIVKSLHAAGISINAREYYSPEDRTRSTQPIHKAIWRGNKELVAYLLEQEGIQLDNPNGDGYTPLMIAVEQGQEAIVDMLLAGGANPQIRNKDGLDASAIADRVIARQQRLKMKIK